MIKMKKLLIATAIAAAVSAPAAQATTFLTDWGFDPTGTSFANSTKITELLDVTSSALINTTVPSPAFTFNEFGTLFSGGHDGLPGYLPGYVAPTGGANFLSTGQITATFNISGSGTLGGTGGSLSYTAGTIKIYVANSQTYGTTAGIYGADQGTLIATLSVLSGSGAIDPTGIPNGLQTITASVDSLLPNYWFNSAGTDLSGLAGKIPPILLGFTTTNATAATAKISDPFNPEMVQFGALAYTGCLPGQVAPTANCLAPTGAGSFDIGVGGQQRLGVNVVPEPSTVALLGAVALLLGGFRMRKNKV